MVSIVTWNVNSLRSRLAHTTQFLRDYSPDIVLLQELKLEEPKFPYIEIEELGYNCAVHGQKTYNGVAILSKTPLEDVTTTLLDDDEQARYIEAVTTVDGVVLRVASVYVPNGQALDSEKFVYKMRFMDALRKHMKTLLSYEEICAIGGDYNIGYVPHDVYDPVKIDGSICYNQQERDKLRAVLHDGWYDAFRVKYPDANAYSWWDYRGGSFEKDHGYRIDHVLLSPEALDIMDDCTIERSVRDQPKPSDHAPVICHLDTTKIRQ